MNTAKTIPCPVCEDGVLSLAVGKVKSVYRCVEEDLPLHYADCDVCKAELATAEQTRINKSIRQDFVSRVDGMLGGVE
jgi:hypothetical protein